ncbi:hypothetical protein B7R22_14300 [Subtercola boreus]|uniref:Uncharacterized protein n=1 Tax=Subtercola boreus TaxID=120213 RepID=A0A3E0VUY0_9MICO|nr:hypothetical protein B7R22_14300 [Subtercola boreus]
MAQPADAIITITQAVDLLTTECFTLFGLTYRGTQDYDQMREEFHVSDQRLYGITDLPVAEVWGICPLPVWTRQRDGSTRSQQISISSFSPEVSTINPLQRRIRAAHRG